MPVATKHVFAQRRVVGALVRAVALAAVKKPNGGTLVTPGPEIRLRVPPPGDALVKDFVRLVRGDPGAYKRALPPHLFPQWAFPAVLRALEGVPYPFARIVNAGCTLAILGPVPKGETLDVAARLAEIDDNGRRAIMHVEVITSTKAGQCLRADFRALAPLGRGKGDKSANGKAEPKDVSDKPRIPEQAREIGRFSLSKRAGLDFAKTTGDFNPIHWAPRYAKAMGFRSVILHGFGSLSWAFEGLVRGLYSGDVAKITEIDANFVRPLVLPAKVGLYVWGDGQVGLGDAPGGPAYMLGSHKSNLLGG
jgi:acyl dehydratase